MHKPLIIPAGKFNHLIPQSEIITTISVSFFMLLIIKIFCCFIKLLFQPEFYFSFR